MRNGRDHVFIDCGPVGLAGRGGHGHNDCLSFEATLDGVAVISDSGAFVYTGNAVERNRFRSTAFHNTPQIDGQEINRFIAWDQLWSLRDDATPEVRRWETGADRDVFVGTHAGYERLPEPIRPVRTIELDHRRHTLQIQDEFEGSGSYGLQIPLHLAPGVQVERGNSGELYLTAGSRRFLLQWRGSLHDVVVEPARVSPSYGRTVASTRIVWRGIANAGAKLSVCIMPCEPETTVECA